MNTGTLFFIPITMGDGPIEQVIPNGVLAQMHRLQHFIVENEKTARQYLSASKHPTPIRELQFQTLNIDTPAKALPNLLAPLLAGHDVGLMSEAGCPGIADPGAQLAALAHQKNIRVAPLVGPSSILLGLMASGLNGQRFSFLGYLPSEKAERIKAIKQIEHDSKIRQETQILIETPYRNQHMLEDFIAHCQAQTKLCIACNVSTPDELIITRTIAQWKQSTLPDLHKKPTVFMLLT